MSDMIQFARIKVVCENLVDSVWQPVRLPIRMSLRDAFSDENAEPQICPFFRGQSVEKACNCSLTTG